jgi:hypothetical protein
MSNQDHWAFIRSRISMDGRRGRHRIPVHAAAVELEERLSAVEDAVMAMEKRIKRIEVALAPMLDPLPNNFSIGYRVVPPGATFEDELADQEQANG